MIDKLFNELLDELKAKKVEASGEEAKRYAIVITLLEQAYAYYSIYV